MADEVPKNRLDAALDRLEEVVTARVTQPMRFLRAAINERRTQGNFDEAHLADEIDGLAARERAESRRGFSVGEEIDYLTKRLAQRGFP